MQDFRKSQYLFQVFSLLLYSLITDKKMKV